MIIFIASFGIARNGGITGKAPKPPRRSRAVLVSLSPPFCVQCFAFSSL